MSEAVSGQECDDAELKDVDSLGELSERSDDEDMEDEDADFVVSDDEEDGVILDDAAWDASHDLVDCDGHLVPREALEMWAQFTNVLHVVSAQRTLSNFLCRSATLIHVLVLRGTLRLPQEFQGVSLSKQELQHMVLSPRLPLSRPATVNSPCRTTCPAITLSALQTFSNSLEILLNNSRSIELEVSPSPSPLEILCGQVALVVAISRLARELLK